MIAHYGYYPNDLVGDSVAWTQEVAWADAALSHFARFRGENEDAAFFYHRSLSYRNLYDPAVGFFHGRLTDGSFDPVFDEISWLHDYTEGNAWQYLWLAPHDPNGLATLLGGEEKAKERLEFFFQGLVNEGILAFPQTYYWHGNEPDLHAALLFTLWGDPDRTTYWLRWIQENLYGTGPDGLAGNDDGGTLSAWYIFTATGLYPIAGSDLYIAVVPLFPKTTMELPDGTFTIRREGEGDHLVRVTLDGQLVPDLLIHHSQLHGGGELVFQVE